MGVNEKSFDFLVEEHRNGVKGKGEDVSTTISLLQANVHMDC